jgi:hypothetical protein
MTAAYRDRFPGFDVMSQARHWDRPTAAVVQDRLRAPEPPRFFTLAEEATADALFDQLLDLVPADRVSITAAIDARLAESRTDGWHYAGTPTDGETWRLSLAGLDSDARDRYESAFADCSGDRQHELVAAVQRAGRRDWHGFVAIRIWQLWMRYACTAFYAHPLAWNEIGFPGPAHPRGYAALGVGRRERFEVADARPRLGAHSHGGTPL